ncbi:MAG TPA: protease pro-enzyme activation domain-containing protein, partial [Terracidiphilus sp.]
MKISKIGLLTLVLTTALRMTAAQTSREVGRPYPDASTPKPVDLGPLSQSSAGTPISFTVALKLRGSEEAERLLTAIHTPGDPQYHQFLTAEEFVARFAPTQNDVAQVVAALRGHGLTAEQTTATTLKVTGLPTNVERAFGVTLHGYQVPAQNGAREYTFHAPQNRATVPNEISGTVSAVLGLDTRPSLRPMYQHAPQTSGKLRPHGSSPSATGNPFGALTVEDFAAQYDVLPLYKHGVIGKGRTLGIVTLASFTPSDAFSYWSALGLPVDANRLTIVDVDGGPGAPSDDSGSLETTIDVEQSGGIAP